jgi:hypothetical protein
VGLVDLEHAHADGVFTAIDTAMNNHGSIHWKEKVVGGGSDGASVYIGKNISMCMLQIHKSHKIIFRVAIL